jgi:uncharacterized protein (UPF0332 family)
LTPSELLFSKAERFIRSAQLLIEDGDYDSAASRIYYAMLYIAEALLEAHGHTFSSHKGVISAYGQLFAKMNILHPRFHQALLTAFSQRQLGDYAINSGLSQEDINLLMKDATEFLKSAQEWYIRQH